jgi:hypothetical protein
MKVDKREISGRLCIIACMYLRMYMCTSDYVYVYVHLNDKPSLALTD